MTEWGRPLAGVLALVGLLAAAPAAEASGFRPDDPDGDGLFRFTPGHEVEGYDSVEGRIRVHFTRTGPDAVRLADANGSGVPDAVELVARTYEEALGVYAALGFRSPESDLGTPFGDGGSDRFDVYLLDFGGVSDGAFVRERCEATRRVCSGFIVQENDFAGYGYPSFNVATRILGSHELFHAVQAAYDVGQGANWGEATAVWGTEVFDSSLPELVHMVRGWLDRPTRAIDQEPVGPVDAFSYGLVIFAQYLSERFGVDLHRQHWEAIAATSGEGPRWLPVLADLLEARFDTTFADAWLDFADWAVRAGFGGDPGETFARAASFPQLAREAVSLPFESPRLRIFRASVHAFDAPPAGRSEVHAAFASVAGDEDLEGLGLVLAARRGQRLETRVVHDVRGSIDARGADAVIVLAINPAHTGSSRRPILCVGDADEVAACAPDAEVPDPGEVEADSPRVEPPTGDTVAEGDEPLGSGCGGGLPGVPAVLALVMVARWRRLVGPPTL